MNSISKVALKKLREIFLDENVTFYMKDINIVTVNEEGQEIKISAMSEGYVIDLDSCYFYVGLPDGTIMRTIPHESVAMTEIAFVGGQLTDEDVPLDEDVH